VEQENKDGFFKSYKNLIDRIVRIVQSINPQYPHPKTLASTLLETNHMQKFFGSHMPSITDIGKNDDQVISFFKTMTSSMINYGK
jgi:hypothetical protein